MTVHTKNNMPESINHAKGNPMIEQIAKLAERARFRKEKLK
jgi:hypothetical protein